MEITSVASLNKILEQQFLSQLSQDQDRLEKALKEINPENNPENS